MHRDGKRPTDGNRETETQRAVGRCIYIVKHKETERKKNRKGLREREERQRKK